AEDAKEMAVNAAWFPVKAVVVGTGMVVGIPVAITRRASTRSLGYTKEFADKIGGSDHIPPMFFAGFWGIPTGIFVGTCEGVYFGGKNAIVNGAGEKPFSLATFSLESGEME